jgi:hypothetical protein
VRSALVTVLLGAALALGACGGDDEDSSEKTTTQAAPGTTAQSGDGVTRSEFIARADSLCEDANEDIARLNREARTAAEGASNAREQLEAVAPVYREAYALHRRSNAALSELERPPDDQETIERIRIAYDEQAALIGRLADAAEAGDTGRFRSISEELELAATKARGLAQGYGFRECGTPPGDGG